MVQILLIIPTGVYGGVTVLAGIQQFREKLIQGWAAAGLALVGVLMLVSAVLLWQSSNSGITVLVLALLSLHSLTINNGLQMHGKLNWRHHLVRFAISLVLIVLAFWSIN